MHINDFFNRLLGRDEPKRDRRRSTRYSTVANWAFLAWREGGRTRISPARLLNISGTGAFVLADKIPDQGQYAWLRLEVPSVTSWLKANVVRHAGALKAGLEFVEHCPYDFLKTATHRTEQALSVPPEFADRYWK